MSAVRPHVLAVAFAIVLHDLAHIGAFGPQPIMTGTGNSIPRQAQFALEFLV